MTLRKEANGSGIVECLLPQLHDGGGESSNALGTVWLKTSPAVSVDAKANANEHHSSRVESSQLC